MGRMTLRISLLVMLVAVGCGDDSAPPPPTDVGPRPDVRDAGRDVGDASRDDASDGGGDDTGDGGGTPGTCTSDGDVLLLGTDRRPRARRIAIAAGTLGVLAVWTQTEGVFDNLFSLYLPNEGDPGEPQKVTDDVGSQRAPDVVWTGAGFVVAWHDNAPDPEPRSFQILTRAFDTNGVPTAPAMQLTTGDEVLHVDATLTRQGDALLLGMVEDDTRGARLAQVMPLTLTGASAGPAVTIGTMAMQVSAPVVTGRGDDGYLYVYGDTSGGAGSAHVRAQPLDATGAIDGSLGDVDQSGNARGQVDAVTTPAGGIGVVFDVSISGARPEVHFRPIDAETGAAMGLEQAVHTLDVQARDGAIAPFGGGFVAAYRALSGDGIATPEIRVGLLDFMGARVSSAGLGAVEVEGGPLTVATASDGSFVITWASTAGGETTMHARRVRCE